MHRLTNRNVGYTRAVPNTNQARTRLILRNTILSWIIAFTLTIAVKGAGPLDASADIVNWKVFTNRSGWSVKYPRRVKIISCRQCEDPTAPGILVMFRDSLTSASMMIEPLAQKPSDRTVRQWLQETSRSTVANPRLTEEWIYIDGRSALNVKNKGADSSWTSNIYVIAGSKTFAIRISNAGSALFRRMLSTFRFLP